MPTSRLTLTAALVLCLGCTKRNQDHDVTHEPEHQHDHGHGHGHGHGHDPDGGAHPDGDNGHGYKGHRFDDPKDWMEHFESAERTAWQRPDALVASLELPPDAKIADLGAGTGYFSVRFAAAAPDGQVFAVDIEPGMVEWLTTRAKDEGLANLVAVQGEAEDPKLPEPVDVVFMCNVFHHLAEPQVYFEAVAASLRPGARVIIVDFRKDAAEDAPGPPAAMRMSPADIRASMEAAGYTLAREDLELLEHQYVLEFSVAPAGAS
ncbi:hypothetical protein ENSA5_64340 [Enhygromyxa salina]|uniref:Methyltransferase domain-containing protein n=1 Tax=Enhygromyxa salina TaxID=215803 RepID=A0A2S9XCD4_9BACT|nr:class I SAM-dependent methyltransferase [Enhygromyxa salina]PRP90519.1 hypothetical protein ENSA5_64340 [Enhygromyxa salina]